MFVCFQYPVRQVTVSDQFNRAGIFLTQPLFGDIYAGMIMRCFVYASYILYHCQNRTDIVRNKNDRTLLVDLLQQFVETRLKSFVDIRIRFVQD